MEIHRISKATIFAARSGADLYTLAKASFMFDTSKAATGLTAYVTTTAEGQTIASDSEAGTSNAVQNVAPAYYPVATFGAECAALCGGLAWADVNLMKGYEYFAVNSAQGTTTYFVSGTLNSTQTLSNDPFDTAKLDFVAGSCWSAKYAAGVNPFV